MTLAQSILTTAAGILLFAGPVLHLDSIGREGLGSICNFFACCLVGVGIMGVVMGLF